MEPSHRIDWFDGSICEDGPAPAPVPDAATPAAEDEMPRYERKLMGYRRLAELAGSEPATILLTLCGRTSFWHLLDSHLKPDFIVLIAKTLLGVCACECNTEVSRSLLQRVLCTRYLPALVHYLRSLPATRISEKRLNMEMWRDAEGALGSVLQLCAALCRLLPSAVEEARTLLDAALEARAGLQEQHSERFSDALLLMEAEAASQVAAAALAATQEQITPTHEGETAEEDYRRASVLPTSADILVSPSCIASGGSARSWASAELYLREQFFLLREDYLAPLRRAIFEYRRQPAAENEHVRCVGVVEVVGRRVAGGRAGYMLALRTAAAAATLVHGSLLLLSADNFRTLLAATVLDVVNTEHVCVTLHGVARDECARVLELEYVALESVTYVEPYRRVLRALQHMQPDTLPFTPHIVHLQTEISPPAYLNRDTEYTLRESAGGEVRARVLEAGSGVDTWPEAARLGLDDSQAAAHRHALTSSLALIQGPPGTGKTHTGVRIVRTLLDNVVKPGAPLLIVCYTNRALDRFLEHLLPHTTELVRLGRQSESEPLRPYTLSDLRARARDTKVPAAAAHGATLRQLEALVARMDTLLRSLRAAGDCPLPYSALKPFLIIDGQRYALDEADSRRDPVHVWLFAPLKAHERDAFVPASWEEEEEAGDVTPAITLSPIEKDLFQREKAAWEREEAREVGGASSLQHLSAAERWTLYWRAADAVCAQWRTDIAALEEETARCRRQLRELATLLDAELCAHARVLGATTTAAARHAPLLRALRINIVLVEESAEVLEAHVLAALTPHTQHLILIGDHRQLRPRTAEHASPLGVSLPERLLAGGVPSVCLREQRRMRPLLLTLICPLVYPDLVTHPAALHLPRVRGLLLDLFFLTHTNRESKYGPETHNRWEAEWSCALATHLRRQDYAPSDITVLTPYAAQARLILQKSSDYPLLEGVRMTTVDDFQGEESRIVILSLVRSNKDGDIGFLSMRNRVCVALSRAREGLYMLGNMSTLSARSALWQSVASTLRQHAAIGDTITLQCHRHPHKLTAVSRAEQVASVSAHGGCDDSCGARLACGHMCRAVCHAYDSQHQVFTCAEPCERRCPRGHTCPLACGATCEACSVRTQVTLACGHAVHVPCSLAQHTHLSCNTCSP